MDNCPRCGSTMSDGFVGASSWPAGIQWFRGFAGPNFFGVQGEAIGATDGSRMAWLTASRCRACRLILARY